jgi:hypothetical protein
MTLNNKVRINKLHCSKCIMSKIHIFLKSHINIFLFIFLIIVLIRDVLDKQLQSLKLYTNARNEKIVNSNLPHC